MEKKEKLQRINNSIQNTMTSAIGIEITDIGDDFISGKMPVDERTVQPFGLLHGGASVALAGESRRSAECRELPGQPRRYADHRGFRTSGRCPRHRHAARAPATGHGPVRAYSSPMTRRSSQWMS